MEREREVDARTSEISTTPVRILDGKDSVVSSG